MVLYAVSRVVSAVDIAGVVVAIIRVLVFAASAGVVGTVSSTVSLMFLVSTPSVLPTWLVPTWCVVSAPLMEASGFVAATGVSAASVVDADVTRCGIVV